MTDEWLRSPSGGVRIQATERGLPIAVKLDERELSDKAPTALAREILLLCQLSARRAQVARRRELVARGFSPSVIRGLNLSTEEELTNAEREVSGGDPDALPGTWLEAL